MINMLRFLVKKINMDKVLSFLPISIAIVLVVPLGYLFLSMDNSYDQHKQFLENRKGTCEIVANREIAKFEVVRYSSETGKAEIEAFFETKEEAARFKAESKLCKK